MVPFIITIVLIAVIRCEEKHYFIPTALRFDDSLYYNENDKANYLFVDFQKLAIYNLCYNDNNYTEVQNATEKTTITFCKTGRSEERRVGKEGVDLGGRHHSKKATKKEE